MKPVVLGVLVAALVACGTNAKPPPPTIGSGSPSAAPVAQVAPVDAAPAIDAPEVEPEPEQDLTCESGTPTKRAEGNADRYAFTDDKTERSGYRNKAGAIVIPATFHDATDFTEGGVADVRLDENTKNPFRFIDPAGKILATPFKFDNGPDYWQDNHARIVDAKGKIGFINDKGVITIKPQYAMAWPFCKGTAKIEHAGKTFYIDHANKRVPAPSDADP